MTPGQVGEPIAGGQVAAGGPGEQTARFASGQGIDLAEVGRMLARARELAGGSGQESVCTMTLIPIYFSSAAHDRARRALEAAAAAHPCRLLSLVAEPKAPTEEVLAQVSATRAGGTIAVERIVLTARGAAVRHLESAVEGLALPEQPRVVVWGGRAEGELLQRLTAGADRMILDSGTRPVQALRQVAELLARGLPLGDLAWARIFPWQGLAADVLDIPSLREHRGRVSRVEVQCAQAVGAEGALLAGWFAARLPKAKVTLSAVPCEAAPDLAPGGSDGISDGALQTAPLGAGHICGATFEAPPARFTLRRERGILEAKVEGDDDGTVLHRVRLPLELPGRLLGLELKLLSGFDDLYRDAVEAAVKLL